MMNKYIFKALIALVFTGYVNSAQASAMFSIQLPNGTSAETVHKGSFFDVGIYIQSSIADLANLGGFDFNVTFDSTKLTLNALSPLTSASVFGAGSLTEVFANSLSAAGQFHFSEQISPFDLNALPQGLDITAPTLLGTLHFQALNLGSNSTISIGANGSNAMLFDFYGNLPSSISVQPANVTILPPAAVPLPASALLFAPGLLALFGLRKNKAQILVV